jgi:hypothetical protein
MNTVQAYVMSRAVLPLTLLVSRITADYAYHAFPFDDAAFIAFFLYRCLDFHTLSIL